MRLTNSVCGLRYRKLNSKTRMESIMRRTPRYICLVWFLLSEKEIGGGPQRFPQHIYLNVAPLEALSFFKNVIKISRMMINKNQQNRIDKDKFIVNW